MPVKVQCIKEKREKNTEREKKEGKDACLRKENWV